LELSATAASKGSGNYLGPAYDEQVRKKWETKTSRLGRSFCLRDWVGKIDEECLRHAVDSQALIRKSLDDTKKKRWNQGFQDRVAGAARPSAVRLL